MREADVDEISEFIEHVFDALLLGFSECDKKMIAWHKQYATDDIAFSAAMLRCTSSWKQNLKNWVPILESTKLRAMRELGEEETKDILFGLI